MQISADTNCPIQHINVASSARQSFAEKPFFREYRVTMKITQFAGTDVAYER